MDANKKTEVLSSEATEALKQLAAAIRGGQKLELEPEAAQALKDITGSFKDKATDIDQMFTDFCKIQQSSIVGDKLNHDNEIMKWYATGFFGAITCFKIYCPYSSDQMTERINWMIAKIFERKSDQDAAMLDSALTLAQQISYDKYQFREMLLNRAKIDVNGNDVDPETNQPTDNIFFYKNVEYQRTSDGMYVSPGYLGLDGADPNCGRLIFTNGDSYQPVRVMYAELNGEKIVIRSNNLPPHRGSPRTGHRDRRSDQCAVPDGSFQ